MTNHLLPLKPGPSVPCLGGTWIVPSAVFGNQRIGALRSPGPWFVWANGRMLLEHAIYNNPCGFHRILTGKQRSIALHCVAEQPFVGCFLSSLLLREIKLALFADKLLAGKLDARRQ